MKAYLGPVFIAVVGFWVSVGLDVFMFHQPFTTGSVITWLVVWTGVLIYLMWKANRDAKQKKW